MTNIWKAYRYLEYVVPLSHHLPSRCQFFLVGYSFTVCHCTVLFICLLHSIASKLTLPYGNFTTTFPAIVILEASHGFFIIFSHRMRWEALQQPKSRVSIYLLQERCTLARLCHPSSLLLVQFPPHCSLLKAAHSKYLLNMGPAC